MAPPPEVTPAPPPRKKERVTAARARPELAPPPPPVLKPENERSAATANVEKPEKVLCAGSNFFYRPLCIHQECKKPENARLAVCIEDRKRYPDEYGTRRP
jgi:hypothetical protein